MGSGLLNRLVKQALGDKQGWARQHMEVDIWHHISATLMSHVGEQLSSSLSVRQTDDLPLLAAPQGRPASSTLTMAAPSCQPVAVVDMMGWQKAKPDEDGVFVGPIRIQCIRATT